MEVMAHSWALKTWDEMGEQVVVVRGFLCLGTPVRQTEEAGRKVHSTHQRVWGTRGKLSGRAVRDRPKFFPLLPHDLLLFPDFLMWRKP